MKRLFRILFQVVVLISAAYLVYRGYHLWQLHQREKALFVYLTQDSAILKKIPSDAFAYLVLYDFKQIADDIQGSKLNDVIDHWFDTGMSGSQKANPMMGGLLEKTILNLIGEEIAVAAVPSSKNVLDIVAVAKLRSGSDLMLKLGLAAAKHIEKIPYQENVIYSFATKRDDWPQFYVCIADAYAYGSSDLSRIEQIQSDSGSGPLFLKKIAAKPIPE
ncbi:MAG: hypothetical protein C5B54_04985, partial [Acidobacteria bacterium]